MTCEYKNRCKVYYDEDLDCKENSCKCQLYQYRKKLEIIKLNTTGGRNENKRVQNDLQRRVCDTNL